MSLRNLNINVVPCYPIGDRNTGDIALTKIHTRFPVVEKENKKYIKELFFTLFIEGIQDKSIEIDDEEVFSFDTNYEIKMRLMELSTGRCMDLDKFETKEKFEKISKKIENIDVFRFTHICFFEDLDLPPDYIEGDFVIEVLVRKLSETEENEYTVQTLYMLSVE